MKLINVEPKDNYILRVYLDNDSIVDFDVKAELERIPCYKLETHRSPILIASTYFLK